MSDLPHHLTFREELYPGRFIASVSGTMRQIGHLATEPLARKFQDYLLTERIVSRLEFQSGSGWAIWVEDEDKIADATNRLSRFAANPGAPEFEKRAAKAEALRQEKEKEQEAYRKRVVSRRHLFRPLTGYGIGVMTIVLMVISIAVFIWSKFATDLGQVAKLFISVRPPHADTSLLGRIPEIMHGQVWRLFTPIFVHYSIMHIFFNMWWLLDLGSMIEARQSSWYLAMLVIVISAVSNLAELFIGHGPFFGGMSGVVYGLLGYIWVRGKYDPGSGLFLHPTTVTTSLLWFFACWAGWLGSIANVCHTAGLIVGMLWGWMASIRYR